MSYRLNQNGLVVRESDGACIGEDPHSENYNAYLAWLAAERKQGRDVPRDAKKEESEVKAEMMEARKAQLKELIEFAAKDQDFKAVLKEALK